MNTPFQPVTRPQRVKLTVEDFLLLDEHGAFEANTRTELIDGEIWFLNAMHNRHGRAAAQLVLELGLALREMASDLRLSIAPSTRIDDYSLPEPDIVVTSYKGDDIVPLESVALLVEISDSTLDIDMGRKLRVYARAGVPEYWVVDLQGAKVHQLWSPEGEAYRERQEHAFGARIEAATVAGLSVATTLLG